MGIHTQTDCALIFLSLHTSSFGEVPNNLAARRAHVPILPSYILFLCFKTETQ